MTRSIWLTTWQLGDDGVNVAVGDHVDWLAFLPTPWEGQRLFAGRRTIDLAVDAHRAAGIFRDAYGVVVSGDGALWSARGVVAGVEAVTVAYRPGAMGDEPVEGSATTEPIEATDDRSWGMCRAHDAAGFVVTLRDEHVQPIVPTLERSVWNAEPIPEIEMDTSDDGASTFADASGWPETLIDPEPWVPLHDEVPELAEGETVVLVASYDEPDAASFCRHPSHRA
ncbi:DUF6578 domain-containing protein [Agrococcus jejuensis]|uniref:Immunity protein 21 n=1 Tax=Agrococcus jejuensis TaxID=399736 RepID=A0A1G8EXK1_9MICO|nr:DUF6578 domain-containing protein [Agrococcus jejuensis]SDH74628.1 hypothetical protein SAMN04489720_2233 [Agrococcus jejuensis]